MVYSMYLTIKETLVGENVTSSLCESYPISTQQYTQYSSNFVEFGGNSDYFIYSNGTMIWICPLYPVCVIDSTCNHYSATYSFLCLHFFTEKTRYNSSQGSEKKQASYLLVLFLCSVFHRLYRPVALLSLVFHSDTPYYACSCCG